MAWARLSSAGVRAVKYDPSSKALQISFENGDYALAKEIAADRYEEFFLVEEADRATYFTNMIAPSIAHRRVKRRDFAVALKIWLLMILALLAIWLLFALIDVLSDLASR